MAFDTGSITFKRFHVEGEAPDQVTEKLLEQLQTHALKPGEFGLEEIEYGWNGGRHIFDGEFSFENNVFADCLFFALRIDSNRVPGEVKKAYTLMEERAVAAGNPSGFISKKQKKDVKDTIRQKLEEDMRSGKFRRSKIIPVLWDLSTGMLLASVGGQNFERLAEIFERSFKCNLLPLSSGSLALRLMKGKKRDYEDFKPSRFVHGPEGESQKPEYPWVAKGDEPKDFLGNEFLLWLWHQVDAKDGELEIDGIGDVAMMFDRSLDLDCAYGMTGKDSLRGNGPTRMPEARDAIRTGKVPRKAGLTLHAKGSQYEVGFGCEGMAFGSLKLPEIEKAENARVLFEERIALLRDFTKIMDGVYKSFLEVRGSGSWDHIKSTIRKWINQTNSTIKPAVMVEV